MARINIEDSLFKENAFIELAIKLGSRRNALGALIEAFMLAQEFYLKNELSRLIPKAEWDRQKIAPEIIEVGLAEVFDDGIYVKGSREQFGWLVQKKEAGQKGGEASAAKRKAKKASVASKKSSGTQAESSGGNPLTLSLSLSPSLIPTQSLAQDISAEQSSTETDALRDDLSDPYLKLVNPKTIKAWVKVYPDMYWVKTELIHAVEWMINNPRKAPKSNYGNFFSGWLKRGWENHRKTIPSKNKNSTYAQDMFDQNPYAEKEAVNS